MLSFITKQKLRDLLLDIGKQEKQLEVLRQILCEQTDFESYASFRRIDRTRAGFINVIDIMNYLTENGFRHKEYEIEYFIEHYDRDRDGKLIYAEFLLALLPLDNPELRTIATQRKVYDVGADEFLVYEVEYALARLISREIIYHAELEDIKIELVNEDDFTFNDAFMAIDTKNNQYIDFKSLKNYLRSCGKITKDDDIVAILRRIDKDDDGRISYEDFLDEIKPHKYVDNNKIRKSIANYNKYKDIKRNRPYKNYEVILESKSPNRIKSLSMMNYKSPAKQNEKKNMKSSKKKKITPRVNSIDRVTRTSESIAKNNIKESSLDQKAYTKTNELSIENHTTRNSLQNEEEIKMEFGKVLKEIINLEKEIELSKQDLSLRSDFNIFDTFRLFDKKGIGSVTVLELQQAYNELGIFPKKDQLYLFISKFDKYGDGKLRFIDFSDAFNPIQPEYYKLVKNRTPRNGDLRLEIDQLFSKQTIRLLKNLLINHIENESIIEALRQKLYKYPKFNINHQFEEFDLNNDGYITIDELRISLNLFDIYITEKELIYLMNRFDKNNDQQISYSEFIQELTPKT